MIRFCFIMTLRYVSQNTHANKVVLVFVQIVVLNLSWLGESSSCDD